MYKKIIDSKNISIMSITTSYLAIFILIGIALINVLWFFLLPAKGERNPTVRLISDMERAIKSSEDAESANWNILRRKVKQYQLDFNLLRDNSGLNQEDSVKLDSVLKALGYFAEGSWRFNEMGEDPERADSLYRKSLDSLENLSGQSSKITVILENENQKQINIGDSIADLRNLVQDQIQYLEQTQGI